LDVSSLTSASVTPWLTITALTSAAEALTFLNWTSHTVPPV